MVQGAGSGSPAPDWCLVKISGGTGGGRSGLSIFTFLSHPPQTAAAAAPAPLLHLLKRHLWEGRLQAASPLASRSPSPLTDSPTQPSEGFGSCEAKAELTCRVRSPAGRGQAPNPHRCPRDGSPGPPKTSPPGTHAPRRAQAFWQRGERCRAPVLPPNASHLGWHQLVLLQAGPSDPRAPPGSSPWLRAAPAPRRARPCPRLAARNGFAAAFFLSMN